MKLSSEALREACRGPHTRIARVKTLYNGVVQEELPVHSGRVDMDRTADILSRFTAEVSDPTGERTPYDLDDSLAPFGTEAIVEVGARIPVLTEAVQVTDTAADWNAGTLDDIVVDGGDLVLGFS